MNCGTSWTSLRRPNPLDHRVAIGLVGCPVASGSLSGATTVRYDQLRGLDGRLLRGSPVGSAVVVDAVEAGMQRRPAEPPVVVDPPSRDCVDLTCEFFQGPCTAQVQPPGADLRADAPDGRQRCARSAEREVVGHAPANRYGCGGTQASCRRHCLTGIAETSVPPAAIQPEVGPANRSSRPSSELLPHRSARSAGSAPLARWVTLTPLSAGAARPG
jgi:hypothetical protein